MSITNCDIGWSSGGVIEFMMDILFGEFHK